MKKKSYNIIGKLIECILQSRVNIKKSQIRQFDTINKRIQKYHMAGEGLQQNINIFLNELLIKEEYNIVQFLTEANKSESIEISITLKIVNKLTNEAQIAEIWIIDFEEQQNIEQLPGHSLSFDVDQQNSNEDDKKQQFQMILILFQELLLLLNKQPLFSQYYRDQQMRNYYKIDYELELNGEKKKDVRFCISQIHHKYSRERICKSIITKIQCYYVGSLSDIVNLQQNRTKQIVAKGKEHEESTVDNQKLSLKQQSPKKCIYEFYDQDMDFVFLSSDDETFLSKQNVRKVEIGEYNEDDEFQMLIMTKDEELLDECKSTLKQLTVTENQYLKN